MIIRSTVSVFIPSDSSLRISQRRSPSTKSIANAPSLVASFSASEVKVPVVINKPFSQRPIIAPRKSRIFGAPTLPLYLLHWKATGKVIRFICNTPDPSIPPSPGRPVTETVLKPDSRSNRCASRSNASGGIFRMVSNRCCFQSSSDSSAISSSVETSNKSPCGSEITARSLNFWRPSRISDTISCMSSSIRLSPRSVTAHTPRRLFSSAPPFFK